MTVKPHAKTLPARYYADPRLFDAEIERFFGQRWLCAGRADAIPNPGDYFLREIAGESLVVVRDQDRVRAFYNVCRHRGTRLCAAAEGLPHIVLPRQTHQAGSPNHDRGQRCRSCGGSANSQGN